MMRMTCSDVRQVEAHKSNIYTPQSQFSREGCRCCHLRPQQEWNLERGLLAYETNSENSQTLLDIQ